jgi:predicted nuclease of predicted toxin-antitoxin system
VTIWLDAQLSPVLANWIRATFQVQCYPIRDICPLSTPDEALFLKARGMAEVVITKDVDLMNILQRFGPPPRILWLRMGNTSNARLKELFTKQLTEALRMLREGEPLVELTA